MFWNRKRLTVLEERINLLEKSIEQQCRSLISEDIDALRNELHAGLSKIGSEIENDPDKRMRLLLDQVTDQIEESLNSTLRKSDALSETTEIISKKADSIIELHEQLMARISGKKPGDRRSVPLGELQQAESNGYVLLWFDGGGQDVVELLVGWSNPPEFLAASVNTYNQINYSAGSVVRSGEYWIATSRFPEESGIRCVFTPFI